MFDRLTKAYLWVMLCMAFSVGITSVEAQKRDEAIKKATKEALIKGLWSGCAELTNPTRQQTLAIIAQMEAHQAADAPHGPGYGDPYYDRLRFMAVPLDCGDYARERGSYYRP
jgi:hypothetical protein